MSLPGFSVRHSVFANMLTIFVIVVGLYVTFVSLNRDVFPETELNLVIINTLYPDASPSEVEDLVTNPIEDAIREIEDIEEYTSSSIEGGSYIVVQIDPDAKNIDRTINDIQRKVDTVDDLPDEAEDPVIEALTTATPVINLCVIAERADEPTLRQAADYLQTALEHLDGVSTVTRTGWRDEEIWVEMDPARLSEEEISLQEVTGALAARNINLPGGKIPSGDREFLLRTIGKFYTPEEIENVVVRSNTDGSRVLVSDLGSARRTFEEDVAFARANGGRTIVLGVKKRESADVIDLVNRVRELVSRESTNLPEGISTVFVDDNSYYVKRRLTVLLNNSWVGMILVMVFLFAFLEGRVALLTALGIPFSFLTAFLIMAFFGITINLMTMFGLIIVLGMVVDDAIIVGENVCRHLEMGKSPRDAATIGATEVMYPVVSTVLTSVAAFMPLIFAPDLYGEYLQWLVYVVVIALAASLIECLVVMPAHMADFMRPVDPDKVKRRKHRVMNMLQGLYGVSMKRILRFRYLFLVVTVLFFAVLVAFSSRNLRVEIFPDDLIDVFFVRVRTPVATALEETDRIMEEARRTVARLPTNELETIVTYVGQHFAMDGSTETRGTHLGQLIVYLTPQETRERKTQVIMDELRTPLRAIEGVERIEVESIKPGPPAGKPLEVKITGNDFSVSSNIAEEIIGFLEGIDGVEDIADDLDEGKDELHVLVDEVEAARLGVSVEDAARTVFAAFKGFESTVIREGKEEIKVRVRMKEPERSSIESLKDLEVPNAAGRLIPLSRIVRIEETSGYPAIYHFNGERVVTVGASVNTEVTSSTEVNLQLEQEFSDVSSRYSGYSLVPSGEWKENKKIIDFMKIAFVIASLLIFSIMVIQFSSFLQPLVVMTSIPLGLIGVAVALALHNQPVSMMAMMGVVGLGGVVVNDAIVLVSFINDRRREGWGVFDAVLDAGVTRLRPILMTSVTTIAGLMPTIYGWGGYEPFIVPAAITLAYGLLFATFLTLAVVPSIYLVGIDIKNLFRRKERREKVNP